MYLSEIYILFLDSITWFVLCRRAKIVRNGGESVLPKAVGNGIPLPPRVSEGASSSTSLPSQVLKISHVSESASSSSSLPSQALKMEKPSTHHSEAPVSAPTLLPSSEVETQNTLAPPVTADQKNISPLLPSPCPAPVASVSSNVPLKQKPDS